MWNKLGSDECSAKLELKDKPPKFGQELKDQKVCEDVEVVFLAKVKGKVSEVTWLLNGQPLEESDNVAIAQDADRFTLTFKKVKAVDHGGKITCKVKRFFVVKFPFFNAERCNLAHAWVSRVHIFRTQAELAQSR